MLLTSVATTIAGTIVLTATADYNPSLIGASSWHRPGGCFPVVLGYVGDRFPHLSGTAFSTIFVVALAGNMAVNKSVFGYIAHDYGISQYPKMLVGLLVASAVLLHLVCSLFARPFENVRAI